MRRHYLPKLLCMGLLIAAMTACGSSPDPDTGLADELPEAPATAPEITANFDGETLALSWAQVDGATGYQVCVAREPITDMQACADETLTGSRYAQTDATTYTFSGLTPDIEYFYAVRAVNAGGASALSSPVATSDLPAPATGLAVTVQSDAYRVNWNPSERATDYLLCVAQEAIPVPSACRQLSAAQLLEVAATSTIRAAQLGVNYHLRVWGRNEHGQGRASDEVVAAVLSAPRNVRVNPLSSLVYVHWDSDPQALGYDVCLAAEPIRDFRSCSAHLGGALHTSVESGMSIGNLVNGRTYYVQVIAWGTSTYGPASDPLALSTHGLNDTGITVGGNYPSGNSVECFGDSVTFQDCNLGRDSTAALPKVGSGQAGFDFTRLDRTGRELAVQTLAWDQSADESSGKKWSCLRDNQTGLTWQVWQSDGNSDLHAAGQKYTSNTQASAGAASTCSLGDCRASAQIERINAESFCGASDWRLPTLEALHSLVDFSRVPTLPQEQFANGDVAWIWSSDVLAPGTKSWGLQVNVGNAVVLDHNRYAAVLAVRGQWRR